MWIFREITDAMFFLACGNHPVKTDCVCEFADTHYHHHYYDSIKFSIAYKFVSFLTWYPLQPR